MVLHKFPITSPEAVDLDTLLGYLQEGIGASEAAVSPQEATGQGLALLVKGMTFVLVSKKKFVEAFAEKQNAPDSETDENVSKLYKIAEKYNWKIDDANRGKGCKAWWREARRLYVKIENEKKKFWDPKIGNPLPGWQERHDDLGALLEILYFFENKDETSGPISSAFDRKQAFLESVLGIITLKKVASVFRTGAENDAYKVNSSAAEKGYGPLMYDLALSFVYPKYIMPDRVSVSPGAVELWSFYMRNRPDVVKEPLPLTSSHPDVDYSDPESPEAQSWNLSSQIHYLQNTIDAFYKTGEMSERNKKKGGIKALEKEMKDLLADRAEAARKNPLDFKYKISHPIDLSKLRANGTSFVRAYNAMVPGKFGKLVNEDSLANLADQFFKTKYRQNDDDDDWT